MTVQRFERIVVVDEHALEVRKTGIGQHRQREIAEMTVVALIQNIRHRMGRVDEGRHRIERFVRFRR